ncbi:MAG: electron transfer flavoprotein subunit beta/FixA family protein [Bryobacteraceae bacterium]|jgi:electron transfer flavoprotein beta subunit
MKIVVAVKQVPARDSIVRINAAGKWIEEEDLSVEINEPDAYALEEALLLKEKHGGEVVVLCAGPERVGQTIRAALAKGADRAIHIECDGLVSLDTVGLAGRLAAAVAAENADLILTGLQSDDLGLGQTGVVMAELLGIPHATIVMQVEVAGSSVRLKRELEDGWFQWVQLPMPALLTIQSGISPLRYATLMGIKKAKTKEIRRVTPDQLPLSAPATVTLQRVYLPYRKKETQIIPGTPAEAAAKLTDVFRFELRVL